MSRLAIALVGVIGLLLVAVGFLAGRIIEEDDGDDSGDAESIGAEDDAEPNAKVKIGDWVGVENAGGCLEVRLDFLQEETPLWSVPLCLGQETAVQIAAGPENGPRGARYWLLTGIGWAAEPDIVFDHEGEFPYPERPELSRNGLIAFVGDDRGLWLMAAAGSDLRRIAPGPVDFYPIWSPSGQMLAYTSGEALAVVDLEGQVIFLDDGPFTYGGSEAPQIRWSPDSTMIAARRGQNVVIMDLNGSTLFEVENAEEPSWSSDGTLLAFLLVDPSDPNVLYYPSLGAWMSLGDGVIHRLESEFSFQSYSRTGRRCGAQGIRPKLLTETG